MRTVHDQRIRDALWRLTATQSADAPSALPPLLFLKTPSIVALWMAATLSIVCLLTLARIRVPRVVRATAVVVREGASTSTLLLLPASSRAFVRPGQPVEVDVGRPSPVLLSVVRVDSALLDATLARRQFADPARLIDLVEIPKLVVRASSCGPHECLTPTVGTSYAARVTAGTRSLTNYALSGS